MMSDQLSNRLTYEALIVTVSRLKGRDTDSTFEQEIEWDGSRHPNIEFKSLAARREAIERAIRIYELNMLGPSYSVIDYRTVTRYV